MHRVLRPGGQFLVTTNGAGNTRELYALTTAFGADGSEPVGIAFGYERARQLLGERFGNVEQSEHPASLRITDPEVVFMALTSYPPGDAASETQLQAFRTAIDAAFARGSGVLETKKEVAVFTSRKPRGACASGSPCAGRPARSPASHERGRSDALSPC
jgi:hypothetical protein